MWYIPKIVVLCTKLFNMHIAPLILWNEIEYQIGSPQACKGFLLHCHVVDVMNDIILCSYTWFVLNVCLLNRCGKYTFLTINTFLIAFWNELKTSLKLSDILLRTHSFTIRYYAETIHVINSEIVWAFYSIWWVIQWSFRVLSLSREKR